MGYKKKQPAAATRVLTLPRFRGGPLALLTNHDHEVICSGGSDIGKSWAVCTKAFMLCNDQHRPGVHGVLARKLFNSIHNSGARTFNTITAGMGIKRLGGDKFTDKWIFPSGSELVCIGLDTPEKLLSSEWDFIAVIQSEQLTESDWELAASRVTGRGAVVAYPQIFGDCNPGGSRHWIRDRAKKIDPKTGRPTLTLLPSTHKDNPALYDDAGAITEEGKQRIGKLESTLSGVRRQRLLEGIWATAEGAVFDTFNATITGQPSDHVQAKDPRQVKRWFLCQDEGYTNPAAIALCGDDADGRRHVYREWYERGKIESDAVAVAALWFKRPLLAASGADEAALKADIAAAHPATDQPQSCELDAVDDAAASLIAALRSAGVNAKGGKGRIMDGVQLIRDRLKVQGDGRPRLTMDPSCVNLINEFESHIMKPQKGGLDKDEPLDCDNHAIAAARYLEDVLAVPTGAITSATVSGLVTGQPSLAGTSGGPRSWPGSRPWPGR